MHGWTTGLEIRDIFLGSDKLRVSFRKLPSVSNGRAEFNTIRAVCDDGSRGDCFTESFYSDVPGAPSRSRRQVLISETQSVDLSSRGESLISLGYAFSPWEGAQMAFGGAKEIERKRVGLSAFLEVNL